MSYTLLFQSIVTFQKEHLWNERMLMSVQDMLRRSKPPSTRRSEIQQLYERYLSGTTLSVTNLLKFLHKEQMELTADEDTAERLIHRYEIEQSGKRGY